MTRDDGDTLAEMVQATMNLATLGDRPELAPGAKFMAALIAYHIEKTAGKMGAHTFLVKCDLKEAEETPEIEDTGKKGKLRYGKNWIGV